MEDLICPTCGWQMIGNDWGNTCPNCGEEV